MVEQEFYVISFESTHYAIMTEKKLKEKFPVDMVPTPRCITASCGLSLKIHADLIQDVIRELKAANLDVKMFNLYVIKRTPQGDEARKIDWQ
ncbi:DUF3343 domain-containing protein [Candidatus Formimonas warabiya]|uniref:Putative Se/S carrier protein-like domain-containing protein n=1 Tax=Formimonas warabiya TaxID=1761012 RepID=A0A3G1KPB2_FORW1|nr:DUF3343 domain-containing protein [Candidatus Formimonas warabiya]ATW24311.1 hypothetical protein DCMF_05470 [Candidatus Formimonas warabiya]